MSLRFGIWNSAHPKNSQYNDTSSHHCSRCIERDIDYHHLSSRVIRIITIFSNERNCSDTNWLCEYTYHGAVVVIEHFDKNQKVLSASMVWSLEVTIDDWFWDLRDSISLNPGINYGTDIFGSVTNDSHCRSLHSLHGVVEKDIPTVRMPKK